MDNEIKKLSFLDKIQDGLIKLGAFIGQQKHFSAIRDAFGAFLPLLIVGALAVMVNSVFISQDSLLASLLGAEAGNELYETWSSVSFYISPLFDGISAATMNLFAVYISFLLGYFLMGSYGGNQLIGGLVGLASFMLLDPIGADGMNYLGAKGIIFAMLAGLVAPMLLWKLQNIRSLQITMPEGVPPVVANSLNLLFPFIITVLIFGIIQPLWGGILFAAGPGQLTSGEINPEWYFIMNALYKIIVSPFMSLGQSPFAIFLILFLIGLFWFFGVHGNNVMGPLVNALWTPMTVANVALYSKYGNQVFDQEFMATTGESLALWTEQTMNSFALMGGASSTLGLIIALSFFSKLPEQRAMTTIATPPSIFNISEPTLFGIPVVLNPIYFLPFIFAGSIQGIVAYFFTAWGIVNPTVVLVPWTAPIFLSGFLATVDPLSIILTGINFAIAIGIYLPFVIMDVSTQTKANALEAGMEIDEYKTVSQKQIFEAKIERIANKPVNKLIYKIHLLENDVKIYDKRISNLDIKLETKIENANLIKEYAEHNYKVYQKLSDENKAQKEKLKIDKVAKKIEKINQKISNKKAEINSKLESLNSKITQINQIELKNAKKEAKLKIEELSKKANE